MGDTKEKLKVAASYTFDGVFTAGNVVDVLSTGHEEIHCLVPGHKKYGLAVD